MKSSILTVLLAFVTLFAIAQDKHQCQAKTKTGTQCLHRTSSTYCKVHDPNSLRCGAPTKSGQPCKRIVKIAGTKCFNHQ